jgi:hypothetical protein
MVSVPPFRPGHPAGAPASAASVTFLITLFQCLALLWEVHATCAMMGLLMQRNSCAANRWPISKEQTMRILMLSLAAVSVAIPATFAMPTDQAEARRSAQYREWRGRDGRTYCRKSDGTTGLIVGGVGGALVGRAVDTDGSRATGTILGAAAGALIGKEVDSKRRCR